MSKVKKTVKKKIKDKEPTETVVSETESVDEQAEADTKINESKKKAQESLKKAQEVQEKYRKRGPKAPESKDTEPIIAKEVPTETVSSDIEPSESASKDEPTKKDGPLRKPSATPADEEKEPEIEEAKPDEKQKPQKKMSMEEKIAAKKLKKENKEEEPVFAGMKLKKASVLKRQWTENELEVVELKAHDFEKIPELEMVNIKKL